MHIFSRGLLVALTSLAGPRAGATTFNEPTDFVLKVRRLFPDVLTRTAEHNVNLVHLARARAQLSAALGHAPGPRPLQTIRVALPVERTVTQLTITPESLGALRASFRQILKNFGPTEARARVLERIPPVAESLEAFDHGPAAREDNAALRASLVELLRFAIWSQTIVDLPTRLALFLESDLSVFQSRAEFKKRWKALGAELGLARQTPVYRILHNVRERTWREAATFATVAWVVTRKTITLAELPPDLAVIKGILAGDCSSRECFGYPLSKFDRVFAVLDEDGEVRGAVSVTRVGVTHEGRETFGLYVNTINGRRIDGDVTRMILRGLRALLAAGEVVLLPTHAQIGQNFNMMDIRDHLYALNARVLPTPIRFLDPADRHVIEQFSFRPYDAMVNNQLAHVLADESDPDLETSVADSSRYADFARTEIYRDDLPRALLEAAASGRRDVARGLWTMAGRSVDEAEAVVDAVTNARGEPSATFEARVRRHLISIGLAPLTVDTLWANGALFERGRLIAGDARASARLPAMLKYLNRHRAHVRTPEIQAWFRRLTPNEREDFLNLLLRAQQESIAQDKSDVVNSELFVTLLSLRAFNARAVSLNLRGFSWPTLVAVARGLAGGEDCDGLHLPDHAATHLMGLALDATRTSEAYVALAFELLGQKRPPIAATITAVGRTLLHFTRLRPTARQIERLDEAIGARGLLPKLRLWYAHAAPGSPRDFVDAVADLGPPRGAAVETVLQAAVHARLGEFFAFDPSAWIIGQLRSLAMRNDSWEDRLMLSLAIRRHVHRLEDLLPLVRTDAGGFDGALMWTALTQLDRLTALYLKMTPAERSKLSPKLDVLWTYVRRDVALRGSATPGEFFDRLGEFRVIYPKRSPHGVLTGAQINHFVSLEPTIAQFRELMRITGEVEGYVERAAPLIHDLADLTEMTRPLHVANVDVVVVRHAFNDLTKLIAKRPDAARFLSERTLDELSANAGLDLLRHELPPLAKACDARLGAR